MKNLYLAFLISLFSTYSIAQSQFDTSALIKVDAKNKSDCVEYYHYKGDVYCSSKVMLSNAINPSLKNLEQQQIVFDDRPWVLAWGQKTDEVTTLEYVPAGDDINNWYELITSQFFPNAPESISLINYANGVKNNLIAKGFDLDFKILQESKNQVIFEFRINSPKNQKQDEIQKVTRMPNGIFILHYVIKKSDMGKENRQKWLSNLTKSRVRE